MSEPLCEPWATTAEEGGVQTPGGHLFLSFPDREELSSLLEMTKGPEVQEASNEH